MTPSQDPIVQKLQGILPRFREFLQSEQGQRWEMERREKDAFFDKHFRTEAALNELDEGTLRELIQRLWAFEVWTNKDYLLEEMLKSGIETIRSAFKRLLREDEPVQSRFDYARQSIRMLGAAGISEILCHLNKVEYPIWNRRAKAGLLYLGVSEEDLPKSSQISGNQYAVFCKTVRNLFEAIREDAVLDDLFDFDYLLFFISMEVQGKETEVQGKETSVASRATFLEGDFGHDTVMEQLLELGDGLGFEVEKEFSVAHGARVDVLWRSRIANLGTISYAFEVHRRGSRDSAILNLQKVIHQDPSIQKVVLVSSDDELNAFRREISFLPEGFRNAVGYFEVGSLQLALNHLRSLKDILKSLGLLSFRA